MEDITDSDSRQVKRVPNNFKKNDLSEYHDFYVQRNALLLIDIIENFRNICLGISELDHDRFLSAPGLAWQAVLKNTKTRLGLLTDIGVLLLEENYMNTVWDEICHWYAKANSKYMKYYDKYKESSLFRILVIECS